MAIEPLHVRLRRAAHAAQGNSRLSALLLEAAAAVPRPKEDQEPRRDTMAVLAAHNAARPAREAEEAARAAYRPMIANAAGDILSPRTFRAPEMPDPKGWPEGSPERRAAEPATCGHCGEEYVRGVTHCPECSARVG